jgi:hypothetical protein
MDARRVADNNSIGRVALTVARPALPQTQTYLHWCIQIGREWSAEQAAFGGIDRCAQAPFEFDA